MLGKCLRQIFCDNLALIGAKAWDGTPCPSNNWDCLFLSLAFCRCSIMAVVVLHRLLFQTAKQTEKTSASVTSGLTTLTQQKHQIWALIAMSAWSACANFCQKKTHMTSSASGNTVFLEGHVQFRLVTTRNKIQEVLYATRPGELHHCSWRGGTVSFSCSRGCRCMERFDTGCDSSSSLGSILHGKHGRLGPKFTTSFFEAIMIL